VVPQPAALEFLGGFAILRDPSRAGADVGKRAATNTRNLRSASILGATLVSRSQRDGMLDRAKTSFGVTAPGLSCSLIVPRFAVLEP
jgi:hypothetical protein